MELEEFDRLSIPAQVAVLRIGAFMEGYKGAPISQGEFIAFLQEVEREVDDEALQMVIDEIHGYIQLVDPEFKKEHPDVDWYSLVEGFYSGDFFDTEWEKKTVEEEE